MPFATLGVNRKIKLISEKKGAKIWDNISWKDFVKTVYVRCNLSHYILETECKVLAGTLCPVTGACSAVLFTLRVI